MSKFPDNIKLLLSDLDGTLLDSNGCVSDEIIIKISQLKEIGIQFSVASGRMFSSATAPFGDFRFELPIITLNGCYVGFPEILHHPITDDVSSDISPLFEKTKATIVALKKNNAYLTGHNYIAQKALDHWVSNISYVDSFTPDMYLNTTAYLITADEKVIKDFYEKAFDIIDHRADIFIFRSLRYDPLWYCEIRSKKANKGSSLKVLREHLGLKKEEVMILGDYYNDIELFQEAGFSAAPSNAVDEIKDLADYVSDKSHDELAFIDIVENLLLR